jgi:hypothetical protein
MEPLSQVGHSNVNKYPEYPAKILNPFKTAASLRVQKAVLKCESLNLSSIWVVPGRAAVRKIDTSFIYVRKQVFTPSQHSLIP